jgi:hypothetical protein
MDLTGGQGQVHAPHARQRFHPCLKPALVYAGAFALSVVTAIRYDFMLTHSASVRRAAYARCDAVALQLNGDPAALADALSAMAA